MQENSFKNLLSAAFMVVIVASCSLFDNLVNIDFTTDYYEITFTIDPSQSGDYTFVEKLFESDIRDQISENGGNIADLKNANLHEAFVQVITGGMNLNAFDWIEVYISTPDNAQLLVGSAYNIIDGLTILPLSVSNEELKDFIGADEYTVIVKGSLGEELTEAIEMMVKFKFDVTVG